MRRLEPIKKRSLPQDLAAIAAGTLAPAFTVASPAFETRVNDSGPAYDGNIMSGWFVPAAADD
jgi:hypothetical protein